MGSYNRVNGSYACESRQLLTDILRGELGFQGFVMSDYLANRSTVASAEAGLDWELGERMWGERLLAAVRSGELALGVVDEMVRRILRPAVALGMVDRPVAFGAIPVERHGAAARELAEQGAVLLKNDGPLLPLDAQAIRSLAVIGVDAASVAAAGGGSSLVRPTYAVSVVEGLRRALPHAAVAHAPGCDPLGPGALLPGLPAVPSGALAPEGGEGCGLSAAYWPSPSFAGEPSLARREPRAELVRGLFDIPGFSAASQGAASLPMDMPAPFSARWRGTLRAHVAGEYTFSLTCLGSGRLTVGGATLIELPSQAGGEADPAFGGASAAARVASASIALAQGEHPLLVEYVADAPGFWPLRDAALRLGWQPPAELATPAIREAAELARSADVAVVVARTFESEEMDRPNLDLPNDQAQLIRAVAAANPRTVVVLMSGGPVEMASWADHTPAILQAWYAGQEQGAAVARLLLGDAAPAGRLPISFPRSMTESPVAAPEQYPGVGGAVHYREGLGVGYRGYDAQGIEPRYPFGYGLTYTSFAYRDLELATDAEGVIQVRFTLANTGQRAGTEVAQVYLGLPEDAAAPPRQLAGWARVALAPGEQRRVAVAIDPRAPDGPLRTWDAQASAWRVVAGACRVYVGQHARHTALAGTLDLSYNGGDPISEETSRQ
ncbi:beta-glucosidase [Chloroflexia bacterium SDU3-3]|nr:beta-glucosidase [Chloroflexia bacterium SDU3-3]